MRFTLSGTPDPSWASSQAASPPSLGKAELPAVGFSLPSGAVTVTAGQATTIEIGVAPAGSEATTVHWQAVPDPGGPTVSPSSGTLTVARATGGAGRAVAVRCDKARRDSDQPHRARHGLRVLPASGASQHRRRHAPARRGRYRGATLTP